MSAQIKCQITRTPTRSTWQVSCGGRSLLEEQLSGRSHRAAVWRPVDSARASAEQLALGSGRGLWWGGVGISPRRSWVEFAVFMICGVLVWSAPVGEEYSPQLNGCVLELQHQGGLVVTEGAPEPVLS